MSTYVRTTCQTCGEIEVTADVVRLRVCRDPRQSYFAVPCPGCSEDVYRPADQHVIELLRGDVEPLVWDVPDELLDGPHPGPPLTYDDLLDVMADVERHNSGAGVSDLTSARPGRQPSAIERLTAAFRRVTPVPDKESL